MLQITDFIFVLCKMLNVFQLRSWKVPKEALRADQALSLKEQLLEARIKQLEASLSTFQAQFDPTVRGKGRGKRSQARPGSSVGATRLSASSSQQRKKPPSIDSDLWTDDADDEEETFFLKNVELTLNGAVIDQV